MGLTGLSRAYLKMVNTSSASIHMPKISCGLAGGTWDKIEPLIKAALIDESVKVAVYDF